MSIRVRLSNGVLAPLDLLPEGIGDGSEFEIALHSSRHGRSPSFDKSDPAASDDDWLPDEEASSLQQIRDENRVLGKEQVRKLMVRRG